MANVPISAFTVPANTVGIGATGYSLTGSASASFMDLAGTWNTSGTPTLIKANVTDTASNINSLLMDLQVGGVSQFKVSKAGLLTLGPTQGVSIGEESSTGRLSIGFAGTQSYSFRSGGLAMVSTNVFGWTSGAANGAFDLFLTRRAAANLRFGAADAAAPVAQTLSVQSVVAGTTNTAGAALTITGSQGTGTGAGGSIIFQVAPAGSSGTAQNALATALTIGSDRSLTADGAIAATGSTAVAVAFARNGTAGTGVYFPSSSNVAISVSGTGAMNISSSAITLSSTYSFGFLSGGIGSAIDTILLRDAANTLAQRNAANAQAFRLYNTWTSFGSGTEIWERANFFWDSNVLKIGTAKGANGGTARALELQTDGTTRLTIAATSGNITTTGSVTTEAPTGGTAAAWRLGTVATVTPTLQNRTIEVDIGGTIYYISAKTTND